MPKPYLTIAWCSRRFITALDIDAETPQQAVAIARKQHDQLLDAAVECNPDYPWDQFVVYDEHCTEVLRVRDDEARIKDAAPALLTACQMVVERWERGDLAEAARACADAIALPLAA